MIKLLCLVYGRAGKIDAQLLDHRLVHLRKNNGGVSLAVSELFQLLHGDLCILVGNRTNRKSNEKLVYVQTGIMVSEIIYLQINALRSIAEVAPRSLEVFPVITRPSQS